MTKEDLINQISKEARACTNDDAEFDTKSFEEFTLMALVNFLKTQPISLPTATKEEFDYILTENCICMDNQSLEVDENLLENFERGWNECRYFIEEKLSEKQH